MNTLFIGRHIVELPETSSTNTYAMKVLKEGNLTEGSLILAHEQTKGRGQYGNSWEAEKGKNLTFSLVIHPTFLSAEKQFYLSKITSLALLGMLTEFLPISQYDIEIKWPNDLLVNRSKIAGILIENILPATSGATGVLHHSVIGVGININQTAFSETKRPPTSLALLQEKETELKAVLERFCKHFEALYLSLKQGRFEQLNKLYLNNLFLFGKEASFKNGNEKFTATICGIEESGRLILKTGDKELKFNFKEIEFL